MKTLKELVTAKTKLEAEVKALVLEFIKKSDESLTVYISAGNQPWDLDTVICSCTVELPTEAVVLNNIEVGSVESPLSVGGAESIKEEVGDKVDIAVLSSDDLY